MARELGSGDLRRVGQVMRDAGDRFAKATVTELGQQTEREAKINANTGSHRKGARTTARKGAGPNVVSGNLRRSITHTSTRRDARGWFVKIGTAATARYGKWVETVLDYPFLLPAAKKVTARARQIVKPLWRSPRL